MNIHETLIAATVGVALLSSTAFAGGPIIVEDTESAPVVVRDKRDNTALFIIGALVLGGLLIGSGGGSSVVCNGDEGDNGGCQ